MPWLRSDGGSRTLRRSLCRSRCGITGGGTRISRKHSSNVTASKSWLSASCADGRLLGQYACDSTDFGTCREIFMIMNNWWVYRSHYHDGYVRDASVAQWPGRDGCSRRSYH